MEKVVLNGDLRIQLLEYGIERRELADAIGCHTNTLAAWLREPMRPRRRELIVNGIKTVLDDRERKSHPPEDPSDLC